MADTNDAVVRAEALTKYYGARRGLDGLNLVVEPGEVFGYLGPNGAGKTTTIRLMLDVIRPSAGRVVVLGAEPRSAAGAAARRRIGYLPGELAFRARGTVGEFLRFLGDLRGGVSAKRVDELAQRLELDLATRLRSLSKGNKQKVGLVQAFMHEPDLLVLDEPTSGLDPLMRQEFLQMVREVRLAGRTVFMSSHVLAEVQQAADRVAILRDGRMVVTERVDSVGKRAVRRVEVHFEGPVPAEEFTGLPGVSDVELAGPMLTCLVDGRLDGLIKAAARHPVVDMISTEPDLEETFLGYYYQNEVSRDRPVST